MATILRKKALVLKPRPTPADPESAPSDIAAALVKLDVARRQRADAEEMVKALQADIMKMMKTKSVSHRLPDGTQLRATKASGRTTTTLDELKLKKRLGAKLWLLVTSRVLDTGKLQSAISTGEVDPVAVAGCVEETVGEPYIVFSRK